jgi:excinuclease ABC subunit C
MRRVRERMREAAEQLDFERAAELRDALVHLDKMEEPTVVLEVEGGDRDVVGYARDGEDAVVVIMRIRGGKLLARDHRFLENIDGDPDPQVLAAYLQLTYLASTERAADLLVPFDFEDREALEASLGSTRVHAPQRGPKRHLVDLADQNARHLLEEFKLAALESDERAGDPVYELQRELGLQRVPRSLVCFDISHAQGTDTVASCVWFENGRPKRAEYRKFKVETVEGIDDFKSMNEVVGRYFRRRVEEEKPLPDLVMIDGGKGQLGAARDAMLGLGLGDLPMISLAKREEEVFVPGRSDSIRIPRRSPALRMLQQARDEAHRFAITFQRKRRTVRTVTSTLLDIPGIGPVKRRQLLTAFGSIQGVLDAGESGVATLPGWTTASARKVLDALRAASPTRATPAPASPQAEDELAPDLTQHAAAQSPTDDPHQPDS